MSPPATGGSLGFTVLGAGRIGSLHARNVAGAVLGSHLVSVVDVDPDAAAHAAIGDAEALTDADAAIRDARVDAVLIASPTSLHSAQVRAAAEAGKAIFCEKPVALDLQETRTAMDAVLSAGVPFQIGFNRRFDPGYAALIAGIRHGAIGTVEMLRSQSSDPAPSPEAYIATSGGFYRDSVIHDIDVARAVAGDIARVTALGRVLVDPVYERHGDVDTSVLTLEFASGALGVLQNSRRTVHGYDLRVEVHGAKGKMVTEDERATKVWRYDERGIHGDYYHFFLDRFADAYRLEVQAFVDAVASGAEPTPGPHDAIEALRVADAATLSLKEGHPVWIEEIT